MLSRLQLYEKETFIEDREHEWGQGLQREEKLTRLDGKTSDVVFHLSTRSAKDGESKQDSSRSPTSSVHT